MNKKGISGIFSKQQLYMTLTIAKSVWEYRQCFGEQGVCGEECLGQDFPLKDFSFVTELSSLRLSPLK